MIRLVLPYPPSVNTYWRHLSKGKLAGRVLVSEEGRKYRSAVIAHIAQQRNAGVLARAEIAGRVQVDIEARMPDRRRRDVDNLPKAVLDALTHACFWHDDSQIDDLRVWRSERLSGELVVTVTVSEAPQPSLELGVPREVSPLAQARDRQ